MRVVTSLKQRAKQLQTETYTLYLAYKDPRVSWYAKAFMITVIGYALSPIDLIPDFIPVLGYVDDLVIVPVGIFLALKMIPTEVLDECREKAKSEPIGGKVRWVGASIIILIWLLVIFLTLKFIWQIALQK